MKLVLISDTHNLHDQVLLPDGDILIHAGDATLEGRGYEVEAFAAWFQAQPHKHKIFVAGNHDFLFERKREVAEKLLGPDVIYLQDSGAEIAGLHFWGSPQTPWFYDWAFNVQRGPDIKAYWDRIPSGTDVLITHGPPKYILDQSRPAGFESEHCGCEDLLRQVEISPPKVHVFGHIHGGYGRKIQFGTSFFNASQCNEAYQIVNKPWVVEV